MLLRFALFLGIIISILMGASFYMGSRLIAHISWAKQYSIIVWLSFAFLVIFFIADTLFYRTNLGARPFFRPLHFSTYTLMALFACFFLYMALGDVIAFSMRLLPDAWQMTPSSFLLGTAMATVITMTFGIWQALRAPCVKKVDIELAHLPAEFENFRIAQISDLHIGPTIDKTYAQKIVDAVNGLSADIIVITGDMIDGTVNNLQEDVEPLRQLQARYGTFSILGNHEYYWNADGWATQMRALNMQILLNSHSAITIGDKKLVIAGTTDVSAEHMDKEPCNPRKALEGAARDSVKILLAHQPHTYKLTQGLGVDLQLSGHTHAGQFFPFSLIVKIAQPLFKGLYTTKSGLVYVNAGTGYWGPPVRFLVPAEVTLLTLKRALSTH